MAIVLEKLAKWAIPISTTIRGVQLTMYDVQGSHYAVIFDHIQGVKQQSIGEGTHFLVPWLQQAVVFDIHTKP
ncbi:hypothetical protein BC936DRAFT_139372 [Jimgerdemannia flammicorona]|uniref:Prohibitin n=1 Tax=Jimgerdemannia flammicorona TaxID=994334 RepID=A0A433BA01_9FUNG|nr:hypothetical protein BC936DRAFT_139372 [Jimgerdemannia flammicorona]